MESSSQPILLYSVSCLHPISLNFPQHKVDLTYITNITDICIILKIFDTTFLNGSYKCSHTSNGIYKP